MKVHPLSSLLVFLSVVGCVMPSPQGRPFHGLVIDQRNNQPIAGAAVLFYWTYQPVEISMVNRRYYLSARESLTDKDGRFIIPDAPASDWTPFRVTNPPRFAVFALGYSSGGLPMTAAGKVVQTWPENIEAFRDGATVKLTPLSTTDRTDQKLACQPATIGISDVPYADIPLTMNLISLCRVRAGLKP